MTLTLIKQNINKRILTNSKIQLISKEKTKINSICKISIDKILKTVIIQRKAKTNRFCKINIFRTQ